MIALIRSEFRKTRNDIQIYLSLAILMTVQLILVTIVMKSFKLSGFGILASSPFRKNLLGFTSFSYLFAIFAAAIVGYHLVSKEYLNHTWELLITGIKDSFKVVFSKYIVAACLYVLFEVLSLTLYTLILQTYFGLAIEWKFLIPIALITITCNAASFTLQLTAHFWIQTAMSAIAFSALLVILPVFLGKSILMTRVIPLLSISYPVTSPTFSSVTCSLLSIWAAAFSLTISLVTAKKFHL